MADIEKRIAFKIAQQFPAIYREENNELVQLVTDYYKFLENTPNQGVYNSRRMFEYRDVTTTLSSMIIFFQKKYLSDLPLLEDASVRLIVKNILSLYRRKGTESGIILFFRMFYNEDVEIFNPAKYILKPSNSEWRTGRYLQMRPNYNIFYNRDKSKSYSYADLLSRNIVGSVSRAAAAIDKINIILVNKSFIPVLYLSDLRGNFQKSDTIIASINGEDVSFGIIDGSLSDVEIDLQYGGTTGNVVGDEFEIESTFGAGGKVVVTDTEDEFTGVVDYTIKDGGWGYSIENTRLRVSNQTLVLNNEDFSFTVLERLTDTAGNIGTVIGQNSSAVGVQMDDGDEFALNRTITTLDRTPNVTITPLTVSDKNNSSPGDLYADTNVLSDVKVETISDTQTIALITDVITPFLNVPMSSPDYNAAPATGTMSGTASPVQLLTPLNEAFALDDITIGTIDAFENIDPGADYTFDVFAIARDRKMVAFDRNEQILTVDNFSALFSVGDRISQVSTGIEGEITAINSDKSYIQIRPFGYYGFDDTNLVHKGSTYNIVAAERDYTSNVFGYNAKVDAKTLFATGRISAVRVVNSGFGYIDGKEIYLINDAGERQAKGTLRANSVGISAGFWGGQSSHINGYKADGVTYFDAKNKIHDSDYYQEFSYEIKSTVDINTYKETLKQNVHLAGTRIFGDFIYKNKTSVGIGHKFFVSRQEDYLIGGDPIVGPNQPGTPQLFTVDRTTLTSDSTNFTSDVD